MFKRFHPRKTPTAFLTIEEETRCPHCGFNHQGWAFEPEYAKLCVKCGHILQEADDSHLSESHDDAGKGILGTLFNGLFGRKKVVSEQDPSRPPAEETHPSPGVSGNPDGEGETHPEGIGSNQDEAGPEETTVDPHLGSEDRQEITGHTPEPGDPEAEHIGACKREGRLHAKQGRHQQAIELLQKVTMFEPNDPEPWAELGRIYYEGPKDFRKSIECCRRALVIDDDLVRVQCTLCLALLQEGRFEEAKNGFLGVLRSVRNSRSYDDDFREDCKALLQDCLGELYAAKKEASGRLLNNIKDIIELIEIEKIYFH